MDVVTRFCAALLLLLCSCSGEPGNRSPSVDSTTNPLHLELAGEHSLHVLGPRLLELKIINDGNGARLLPGFSFAATTNHPALPSPNSFRVLAGGRPIAVTRVGVKRRPVYAPLKVRELRVATQVYLELEGDVADNVLVEVKDPGGKLWPGEKSFSCICNPLRWSPTIHVNQTGYTANGRKRAMVGFYLGSLGEMDLADQQRMFKVVKAPENRSFPGTETPAPVLEGKLKPRPDNGFPYACYSKVFEADFTELNRPGRYRLFVPGLGVSFPFVIDDAVIGAFTRAYALGVYHQRCGTANALPFTRFSHDPCHTAPAEVPTMSARFASVNASLAKESDNCKENPRHKAPQLKNIAASLYPFANRGPVDLRGGHHDAGDYSKYTINSAGFIHHLVFAADVFPGAAELDNLGLPESGDGKSDLLQEAKWEADFLAKMQDADGGFYFLVYPRDREYENDVTPDHGDPQVVFPKTTAVTAAAAAALAQCSSSPLFKKQFPSEARDYLERARKGWDFLERAIAKHGKDGAYQKITHYGDEFMHDDELAWVACELFLATGDEKYHKRALEWLKPSDPATRKWGWLRLFDSYGCAIRSYAFGVQSGRIRADQANKALLQECHDEIAAAGEEQLNRARNSAYGASFPEETKRARSAGWYFSCDAAFELACACQLPFPGARDLRPAMQEAIWSNLNYEQGCNPVNVTYLTGLGWKRQREIVHQYAQNDRRVLPPSGIPLGNIQDGFGWLDNYQHKLADFIYPSDGEENAPYPIYDRWGDSFNLSQEFVILNQARALGCLAWLMAQTPLKTQPWKPVPGTIAVGTSSDGRRNYTLKAPGLDLSQARVVWEAEGREPVLTGNITSFGKSPAWVEAEGELPDGRRVFGVTQP